jgi:hypothetical protein
MINANDIKPKENVAADLFSWQLYKWVKKYPGRTKVYEKADAIPYAQLFIGAIDEDDPGWFYGIMLRSLCRYGERLEIYEYGPARGVPEWRDVTEKFWSDYMKIGVCAIQCDFVHKWVVDGDKRVCQCCGKVEIKRIKMVTKEVWEDAENTSEI